MATHAHRFESLDLPRPFRSAWPLLALAALTLALLADPQLPLEILLVGSACFAAAAAVQAGRARHELATVRRTADRLILHEAPGEEPPSELVRWRSQELTAPEARSALQRELERTIRQLDPARLPSASPLQRGAVRRHRDLLETLAARVGDEQPVSARGLVLTRQLLRDPASPLYAEDAERQVVRALTRALGALEP